ncbi:MAG TPA: hypothetical protein VJH88_01430 [Candidatus Nanoarchaeia archaeon]|nr:hypothetical protein [Candidatus Nanoarchaeia archaeon]
MYKVSLCGTASSVGSFLTFAYTSTISRVLEEKLFRLVRTLATPPSQFLGSARLSTELISKR